jgi:hypothetical protein
MRRQPVRPVAAPLPVTADPVAVDEAPAAPPAAGQPPPAAAAAQVREPSVTRFTARDYTYVRRELRRIAILAVVMVITIVVLSFFLP